MENFRLTSAFLLFNVVAFLSLAHAALIDNLLPQNNFINATWENVTIELSVEANDQSGSRIHVDFLIATVLDVSALSLTCSGGTELTELCVKEDGPFMNDIKSGILSAFQVLLFPEVVRRVNIEAQNYANITQYFRCQSLLVDPSCIIQTSLAVESLQFLLSKISEPIPLEAWALECNVTGVAENQQDGNIISTKVLGSTVSIFQIRFTKLQMDCVVNQQTLEQSIRELSKEKGGIVGQIAAGVVKPILDKITAFG